MAISTACRLRSHTVLQHCVPLLRSTTLRKASTSAPARSSLPRKAVPSNLPSRSSPSSLGSLSGSLTTTQKKQQYNARKLFEAGVTRLYKAPRDWSFVIGSCTISCMCFSMVYGIYLLGPFDREDNSGLHPGVRWTQRALMAILSFGGWWVLLRTGRRIYAIDLVSQGDRMSMLVTLRRPFPFVRRKRLAKNLEEFRLSARVVEVPEIPDWAEQQKADSKRDIVSRMSKRISVSLYGFFTSTRKIVTGQGVLDADIKGEGIYKLDMAGSFHNDGQSLRNVVSIER